MTEEPQETAATELARRWLVNQRSRRGKRGSADWADGDAFDDVLDLMMGDEVDVAWQVVMAMWLLAESEQDQWEIAVGPLEDLLRHHGAELLERVEAMAAADSMFRRALRGIYTRSPITELVSRFGRANVSSPGVDEEPSNL